MKSTITFSLIIFCISSTSIGQVNPTRIALIEKEYQECLDKGEDMLGCSNSFYRKMDSCLNVTYQQLRKKVNKEDIKKEQLAWLKKRDLEFIKIDKNNEMEGKDGEMIRLDLKAKYVQKRVIVLIDRL